MDSIAQATYWTIRGSSLFLFLHLLGLVLFGYIVARRLRPLLAAQRDPRFDRPWLRLERVLQYWLGQWRHPRYRFAGVLHILIFTGFLILASRAFALLALGVSDRFAGAPGGWYDMVHAYASTAVLLVHGGRHRAPPDLEAGPLSALSRRDFPAGIDRPADGRGRRVRGQRGCISPPRDGGTFRCRGS